MEVIIHFYSALIHSTRVKLPILEKCLIFVPEWSISLRIWKKNHSKQLYCLFNQKIFRTNPAPRGVSLDNANFDDETYRVTLLQY